MAAIPVPVVCCDACGWRFGLTPAAAVLDEVLNLAWFLCCDCRDPEETV